MFVKNWNTIKGTGKKGLALIFLFIVIGNGCTKKNESTNPFFIYNFGGLENLTPKQQIDTLRSYGYKGIALQMAKAKHVSNLPAFLSFADSYHDFKVQAVFVRYNFNDPEADKNRWMEVVDLIQDKKIALWFIFGKPEVGISEQMVEKKLREVVDYATKKKVPVTLYPHSNCFFYSAEQALPVIQRINSPNLKLAVHTCHEMRAGNGHRLNEVVENVKDYLGFVTIAGADKEVDRTNAYTMDKSTIQPLHKSEFDLTSFLQALKKINYKAPVGFINFKIDEEYGLDQYLPESLNAWELIKKEHFNYDKK